MTLLILGVVLWSAAHLIPTLAQPLRRSLIARIGANGYRGAFSLAIVISIVLMVFGWRATPPNAIYLPPEWTAPIGAAVMWAALFLFASAQTVSKIRRLIRHPQLMSVALWGISHLITNGASRSLILFGGLSAWALIEMPLINSRDGLPEPAPSSGWAAEVKIALIASVLFVVLVFVHPYIAGVSVIPA